MDSRCNNSKTTTTPLSSPVGSTEAPRCGTDALVDISLQITPTTGGGFVLSVNPYMNIENLKKTVAQKLKVHKERICLLYKDKILREGSVYENGLIDGARLTLLPSVETGLLSQRPELSVMQALESLNEGQVNDFLSGKAPLNLSMRFGDNMMLIQLQLHTVTTVSQTTQTKASKSGGRNATNASSTTELKSRKHDDNEPRVDSGRRRTFLSKLSRALTTGAPLPDIDELNDGEESHDEWNDSLDDDDGNDERKRSESAESSLSYARDKSWDTKDLTPRKRRYSESAISPITSLSELASRQTLNDTPAPVKRRSATTVPVPTTSRIPQSFESIRSALSANDPIAAGLTSCLCKNLQKSACSCNLPPEPNYSKLAQLISKAAPGTSSHCVTHTKTYQLSDEVPRIDPNALAQASRNLTKTIRQLSTEALTMKEIEMRAAQNGKIIESMHNHGRGVYSGTFSGTLNPALQDSRGRPKRDLSTIVHILNDLLCTGPPPIHVFDGQPSKKPDHDKPGPSRSKVEKKEMPPPPPPEDGETKEENMRTRDKIEQLRLVMGERRERRLKRKEKMQPYPRNAQDMDDGELLAAPLSSVPA